MISQTPDKVIFIYVILLGALFINVNPALAGIGVEPTITELEVAPGDVKTGSFRVANGGEETVLVNVEVEDWLKMLAGESPVDVEDWLVMDETEFELEPAEIKSIGYRVMAPAGIEGELVAMVFFSSAVPGGASLNITSRFGVAVYAGIEGTEVIDAGIEDIKMRDTRLIVSIKNKGNVHLRPSGRVLIKDSGGNLIDELDIPYTAVIFAGKSHAYPLNLEKTKLPSGECDIEVLFETGTIYDKNKTFRKATRVHLE